MTLSAVTASRAANAKEDTSPAGRGRAWKASRGWTPSSPTWPAPASAPPSTSTPPPGRTTSAAVPRSGSRTCAPTCTSGPAPTSSRWARRRLPGHALVGHRLHVASATSRRWGDAVPPECAARRWSEPSGTIVHRVLGELGAERRVILWNTVPTHPHRPGVPLSNRRPTVAEVAAGAEFAERLIALVRPATRRGGRPDRRVGARRAGHLRPPSRQRRGDGLRRGHAGYPRRAVRSAHSSE